MFSVELFIVEMANSLNGSVHNLLGKVIGTNITGNGENFSTKSSDFTLYGLKTFGVNATVALSVSVFRK
jgi:hypothetical protein